MCPSNRLMLGALALALALQPTIAHSQTPNPKTTQYKRVHQELMRLVIDGRAGKATQTEVSREDPETCYVLAVAFAQLGDLDQAMRWVKEAVARGLPVGRFLAGPRGLLDPLQAYEPFLAYIKDRFAEPIHGPMLGRMTHEGASFWVRTATEAPVQVRISEAKDLSNARESDVVRSCADADYTAIVTINGLSADTAYYYEPLVDGAARVGETPRAFRTLPDPGRPASFRVGFGGGAGYVPPHERMWDTIRTYEPLAFILLGDNVYIDDPRRPSMQDYCYYRRQSRAEFRRFVACTPIYAIYDDHDFGENDCWGGPEIDQPKWKRDVWHRFTRNWVNPYYGGAEGQPGCWFDFAIADVDFFCLDCRYYRMDPKRSKPSMLGPVQKAWLFDALDHSSATFKVLVSSVPWARGTKPGSLDTWDGYPGEREAIFTFIEAHGIDGVILLSADRHRSDVWKIPRDNGYDFYEFESSRLTNQHVHKKMKGALFSYNESQSFGLLTFDTKPPDPQVTYAIVNIDGTVVHETRVKHSQVTNPTEQ